MKVLCCHALLIAAVGLWAQTSADYTISAGSATEVTSNPDAKFIKEWSLTARANSSTIDAIDLGLAGHVYVSYVKNLPSDIVGYVKVSSNTRDVVNAVLVDKHDRDDDHEYDDSEDSYLDDQAKDKLSVWLKKSVTHGDLLTEITLAASNTVLKLKSRRSAQVVIEDNVLVQRGSKSEQKIKAEDHSAVFVSSSTVDVRKLSLKTDDHGRIEFKVNEVSVAEKLLVAADENSNIKLLSSSVKTDQLELSASKKHATICVSAEKVTAEKSKVSGKKQISLPQSSEKYHTKGTFVCERSELPVRRCTKFDEDKMEKDDDDDDSEDEKKKKGGLDDEKKKKNKRDDDDEDDSSDDDDDKPDIFGNRF